MLLKKFFVIYIIFSLIINNSYAESDSTIINNDRYEVHKSSNLKIDNGHMKTVEDFQIEGKTIKNLVINSEKKDSWYITDYLLIDEIKNNTEYTIAFTLENVVKGDYKDRFKISIENKAHEQLAYSNFENGRHVVKLTTRDITDEQYPGLDTTKDVKVCFWTYGVDIGQRYSIKDIVVTEGDETNSNLNYFERYKSVGDKIEDNQYKINLNIKNKNLLEKHQLGSFYKESSLEFSRGNYYCSIAKVEPNKNYTLSPYNSNQIFHIEYLSKSGDFISFGNSSQIRTPSACYYIKIRTHLLKDEHERPGQAYENPFNSLEEFKNTMQLEEGYNSSNYIDSKSNDIEIILPTSLKSLNGVSDRLYWNKDKGKYIIEKNISESMELLNPPILITTDISDKIKLDLFDSINYLYSNSEISPILTIKLDRIIEIATNKTEEAVSMPTLYNISLARMWVNQMPESLLKDEMQMRLSDISNMSDIQLDKKNTTSNLDLYIKSENMLSLSLNTNSITFEDFTGIEDLELNNALNLTINSSLPYELNAYLATEIQNSDKSKTMDKSILNIKESSESNYKAFNNINEKLILKDNNIAGNNLLHSVDLLLRGGISHEKDIYKTTIKFEVEQK